MRAEKKPLARLGVIFRMEIEDGYGFFMSTVIEKKKIIKK